MVDPLQEDILDVEWRISEPLPVLVIKDIALFPKCIIDVSLEGNEAVRFAMNLESSKEPFVVLPKYKGLVKYSYSRIGTIARFITAKKRKNGFFLSVYGFDRVKILGLMESYFYPVCKYEFVRDVKKAKEYEKEKVLLREIIRLFKEWVFLLRIKDGEKAMMMVDGITSLSRLVDFIAHYYIGNIKIKKKLYTEISPIKRAMHLKNVLSKDIKRVI